MIRIGVVLLRCMFFAVVCYGGGCAAGGGWVGGSWEDEVELCVCDDGWVRGCDDVDVHWCDGAGV